MSNLTLNHKFGRVKVDATKKEMHDFLKRLTDEDFNGNNGEDYFIEVQTSTGTELMSSLEACLEDYNVEQSIQDKNNFILSTINSNYGSDSYYKDHNVTIDNLDGYIIASVAILEG